MGPLMAVKRGGRGFRLRRQGMTRRKARRNHLPVGRAQEQKGYTYDPKQYRQAPWTMQGRARYNQRWAPTLAG